MDYSGIISTIRRIAPEFANPVLYPDSVLTEWIDQALIEINYDGLVDCLGQAGADIALAYYVAHLMTQSGPTISVTGQGISKEKMEDSEITYGTPSSSKSHIGSKLFNDKYWNMYVQKTRMCAALDAMILDGK